MNLDVLVFAAHPDDAELSMSGTIIKLTSAGKKVGIIDLCRGEMGSRGTAETRKIEWQKASEIMQLTIRENLNLPDGSLRPNPVFIKKVVEKIRLYNPKIIFAPHFHDRHPDHTGTSQIVKEAFFFTGNHKFNTEYERQKQVPYRPKKLFYFMQSYDFIPSFIVDITDTYSEREKAILAYSSQFYNPNSSENEPQTFISKPEFIENLEARSKFYGFKIGKKYGEPFFCEESIELDILNLVERQD